MIGGLCACVGRTGKRSRFKGQCLAKIRCRILWISMALGHVIRFKGTYRRKHSRAGWGYAFGKRNIYIIQYASNFRCNGYILVFMFVLYVHKIGEIKLIFSGMLEKIAFCEIGRSNLGFLNSPLHYLGI
jgi:hypothetical protein